MTYPLSQSQLSIYLACQGLEPEGGNYQQASLYKLPGNIDIERLAAAAEAVIRAHPYALSRIVLEEGMPRVEDIPVKRGNRSCVPSIRSTKSARASAARWTC